MDALFLLCTPPALKPTVPLTLNLLMWPGLCTGSHVLLDLFKKHLNGANANGSHHFIWIVCLQLLLHTVLKTWHFHCILALQNKSNFL